ncbi:hypothetical protein [Labedaea rhizosphaerae]|nr:hypothetical protein [Labedaea rhizosphaerae]
MASAQTPGVAQGAQPIGYRQGLIVQYNPQTGENVVRVAGVDLVNLPTLVQGYGTVLRVGMPVGVLIVGSQMVILGRLAIPDGVNNVNVPFVTYAQSQATNFAVGTTAADVVSVQFQVPDWANSVNFGMGSSGYVFNSATLVRRIQFQITVNGGLVAGENIFTAKPATSRPWCTRSRTR